MSISDYESPDPELILELDLDTEVEELDFLGTCNMTDFIDYLSDQKIILGERFERLPQHIGFDSYMLADDDLVLGGLRLLEVDNKVYLMTDTTIRLLITSADVLHS
jgi:heme/copper-type cytochrome/quinol oxidase subunit 2